MSSQRRSDMVKRFIGLILYIHLAYVHRGFLNLNTRPNKMNESLSLNKHSEVRLTRRQGIHY
jgi:hypothetical protein